MSLNRLSKLTLCEAGGIAFENIEDLEVHLNKIDVNLAADLKKAAYDKVNHRKAVEDLKRSKDALQRRLISLLGIGKKS